MLVSIGSGICAAKHPEMPDPWARKLTADLPQILIGCARETATVLR
jgi:hypothetical protein